MSPMDHLAATRGKVPPDFKFELQHLSLAIEALLRCSVAESFSWAGIETFSNGITLALSEVG